MNAVQKKQLVFALGAVIVVLGMALAAVASPVSAAQIRVDDSMPGRPVRGSASATPDANPTSSPEASRSGEVEIFGVVESINGSVWVIDGRPVTVSGATEVKGALGVGSRVKVHVTPGADGSLTAREIEPALGAGGVDDSGDDVNDDNGGARGSDDDGSDDRGGSRGSGSDDNSDDSHDDDDDNRGPGSGDDDDHDDDRDDDHSGSGSGHDDDDDDNSGRGS